jgi:predicted metal-dependent hydrolase
MSENNGIFVVRSIANTVNTISELDDLIIKEKDEVRLSELRKRREQLIEVLKELAQELDREAKPLD